MLALRDCLAARTGESPWVFADAQGACWLDDPEKPKPLWRPRKRGLAVKKAVGIEPGFRFHDLRRIRATHLLQAGAARDRLQQAGGWKTSRMVDVYARLETAHLLDTLNLIPRSGGDDPASA